MTTCDGSPGKPGRVAGMFPRGSDTTTRTATCPGCRVCGGSTAGEHPEGGDADAPRRDSRPVAAVPHETEPPAVGSGAISPRERAEAAVPGAGEFSSFRNDYARARCVDAVTAAIEEAVREALLPRLEIERKIETRVVQAERERAQLAERLDECSVRCTQYREQRDEARRLAELRGKVANENHELQAEVERLTKERDEAVTCIVDIKRAMREQGFALQAEVERQKEERYAVGRQRDEWMDKWRAERAEVERLRGLNDAHLNTMDRLGQRCEEYRSEIERLRSRPSGEALVKTLVAAAYEDAARIAESWECGRCTPKDYAYCRGCHAVRDLIAAAIREKAREVGGE